MRILHTSDWHLGQNFFTKNRAAEHKAFIQWLLEQVETHAIDAVIVAGDIFDTGTPASYAREIYFDFVVKMQTLNCTLVVLGGNHDSASTLNESRSLLAHMGTYVVAHTRDEPEEQLVTLRNSDGTPGAILCAIPYIRPRDVMRSTANDSSDDKQQRLGEAIRDHYQQLYALADAQRQALDTQVPIIMTGHLTVIGASCSDSVRDIYIGTLDALSHAAFPDADYIALGHIHRAQKVGSTEHIRYSGSPIPLSFDELGSTKSVNIVKFNASGPASIKALEIPSFQPMRVIRGDLHAIEQQLNDLAKHDLQQTHWLCIEVDTHDYLTDLQTRIETLTADMNVDVLQLRRAKSQRQKQIERQEKETLAEITPADVFERRLEQESFDDERDKAQRERIRLCFNDIVSDLEEQRP